MKCTQCGAELVSEDKFCGECGAPRPQLPPPLAEIERRFHELRARYQAGELDDAAFEAELQKLVIKDDAGSFWTLGRDGAAWYWYDGEQWVQRDPLAPLEAAPPPAPRRVAPSAPAVPPVTKGRPWKRIAAGIGGTIIVVALAVAAIWASDRFLPARGTAPSGKPIAEILSPPIGSQVALGEQVEVEYRASDAVAVVRVELEADGRVVDGQNSPVPEGQPSLTGILRWTPATPGTHTLLVRAYNRDRIASDAAAVEIVVAEMPEPTPTEFPPTATPTPTLTPTEVPPTATSTPSPTATPTQVPPTATRIPPTPTMGPTEFDPIIFATGLDAEANPAYPATTFPPGTTIVYAVWACRGVYPGLELVNRWYLNGQEYASSSVSWDRPGERGRWWVSLYRASGAALPSGSYQLELYVGGRLLQSGTFAIQ